MRTHLSRSSLGQLLPVLFFLLAALPAGAIGVLLTRHAWERELRTVQEQHLQIARNLTEALTRYAHDAEAVFTDVVEHLAQHQPGPSLPALLARLHFKYVSLVDSQGHITALVAPDASPRPSVLPTGLLDKLRAGGSWEVLSDTFDEPTIFLLRQLTPERYAVGALQTSYFISLQSTIAFGEAGHAVIVDRRGRVIAHPIAQWQTTMRDLSQLDPVRHMMDGEAGVTRFFSPALRAEVIAGFSAVPSVGWGVMIPQPLSELAAHVGVVQRAVWCVIALALCAAALLGILVSRWLASPLRHIGTVAERFANGHYEARVHDLGRWHTREAARLAAQFNTMAADITRSWQAHNASEQRFREFAQIAADWFWETDCQQVFRYVSPPPVGGRQHEIDLQPGHHRREYLFDDSEGKVIALIQGFMDRAAPFHDIEFRAIGQDGHPVPVSVSGRPIYDATGNMIGYRGVTRDITARLEAEAQLYRAQQDVQQRQAQKMEAIGVLAGGIAHDFNNILTAIMGYADLALHDLFPSHPTRRYLQEVMIAGQRAQSLVRQILTFSRTSEPERIPVQLHLIVKEALKLLRASLPSTIEILQDIDGETGTILADPTQLHQVLINLCANAEYAMRDTGGVLDVRLEAVELEAPLLAHHAELPPGPYVRLTMHDTGHGIAPEVANRVFDPFFTTKDVGQGTGMGLAVVHGIVTSHGGAITMQSTPGDGTTFALYLPRLAMVPTEERAEEKTVLAGEASILFVDDEQSIAYLGQQLLERLGYHVLTSTSSRQALELFSQAPQRFDLVISDQTMPQMTGEVLIRELRKIRPDIPVILCTGFSYSIDADKAQAQGIDAFLLKPLVSSDLGLAIRQVLSRRTTMPMAKDTIDISC